LGEITVRSHSKELTVRKNAPAWEGLVGIVPDLNKEHQSAIVTAFLRQMESVNISGLSEERFEQENWNDALGKNTAEYKRAFYNGYQALERSLPHLPESLRGRALTQLAQFTNGLTKIESAEYFHSGQEPEAGAAAVSN
jgi:hypothetical protein